MSSNLYKAGWVTVGGDVRVIDTNELVEKRLSDRAVIRNSYQEEAFGEEDGFSSGLEAQQVDALLDPDGEGAVLKSASLEEMEHVNRELAQAKEELEQVRAQADRMLQDANAQIEAQRMSVLEEAKAAGYQDGYAKGMEEAETLKNQYLEKQSRLEEAYDRQIEALEPEFVETLSEIYEHIFKVDLSAYRQLVVNLLTDAMQKTDSARHYIIHVSGQDYPEVSADREKILEETGTLSANLEIISDMTLSPSQCMIETENGIYDCSLGTELEELRRRLKLVSFQKPR